MWCNNTGARSRRWIGCLALALLAACGGGGGDEESEPIAEGATAEAVDEVGGNEAAPQVPRVPLAHKGGRPREHDSR